VKKKQLDMQFDPQETSLDKPKHGQEDPSGGGHTGGNTFAGGVRFLLAEFHKYTLMLYRLVGAILPAWVVVGDSNVSIGRATTSTKLIIYRSWCHISLLSGVS
jgi:hypothetical protein